MSSQVDELKKRAALRACEHISDGMLVGLGTGSTAKHAIIRIGEMVEDGMKITAIPTSVESEKLAIECKIPLKEIEGNEKIDITIDGADEISPDLTLIKGLGGALLREKVVACMTNVEIIVADESKIVANLGEKSPLPVEVAPFAVKYCSSRIAEFSREVNIRVRDQKPFVTDNGNLVLDIRTDLISNPVALDQKLKSIPGVVDNGLFIGIAKVAYIAMKDGTIKEMAK